MGESLNQDIGEFRQELKREVLEACAVNPIADRLKVISNCLKNCAERHATFIEGVCGIGVGSIFIIDPDERTLVPLFSGTHNRPSFGFEYRPLLGLQQRNLIEAMFACWRQSESIGSLATPLDSSKYPPEYSYYTRQDGYKKSDSGKLAPQDYLHVPYHHVPAGEVLFFMLAWRVLLRLIQFRKGRQPEDSFQRHDSGRALFVNALERYITARELAWIKRVESFVTDQVAVTWRNEIEPITDIAATLTEGINKDLDVIKSLKVPQLSKDHPEKGSATSLIEIFLRRAYAERRIPPRGIESMLRFLDAGSAVTDCDSISAFVHDIMVICKALLCPPGAHNNSTLRPYRMLSYLQMAARFPILPYFYWCFLTQRTWEHLAIPVWDSPMSAYKIHSAYAPDNPEPLGSFAQAYQCAPNALSTTVAYGVFGIVPRCIADNVKNKCTVNRTDIELIRDFTKVFSDIAVDCSFYTRIQKSYYEHNYKTRLLEEYVHTAKNQLDGIGGWVAQAADDHSIDKSKGSMRRALLNLMKVRNDFDCACFRLRLAKGIRISKFDLTEQICSIVDQWNAYNTDVRYERPCAKLIVEADLEHTVSSIWELITNAAKYSDRSKSERKTIVDAKLVRGMRDKTPAKDAVIGAEWSVVVGVYSNRLKPLGSTIEQCISCGKGLHGIKCYLDALTIEYKNSRDVMFRASIWIDRSPKSGVKFCFNLPAIGGR